MWYGKILEDYKDDGKKVTQVELANILGMQVVSKGENEYIIEKED